MAILFKGAFKQHFRTEGVVNSVTSSGTDTSWTNIGLQVEGLTAKAIADLPASKTTLSVSTQFYETFGTVTPRSATAGIEFRDNDVAFLRLIAQDAGFLFQVFNGSWTTLVTCSSTTTSQTLKKLSMDLVVHASTGSIVILEDGAVIGSATGVNTVGSLGVTAVDSISLGRFSTHTFCFSRYSEFIVADETTAYMRLFVGRPNAAGNVNTWTGAYTTVDETTIDISDFLTSNTANQEFLFGMTNPPSTTLVPKDVSISMHARKEVSGPQQLQAAIRTNGTNYFSATQALAPYFNEVVVGFGTTNPQTGLAWTVAEIDALEIGGRSIA